MRFGIFGTGYWAAEVHAAALAADDAVEIVGVWGRNAEKAAALAERYATQPYADVDALIADVDAVDVALPPDVQAPIAAAAARAGKHLLLDKPLALDPAAAWDVVGAAEAAGVSSAVFFTTRFKPEAATWIADAAGRDWHGAQSSWLGSIFQPDSPFAGSAWRRERGGLWDIGPHALSVALPVMGPAERVAAAVGDRDGTVHVTLAHASGACSLLSVGLDAPPAAQGFSFRAYGDEGWSEMPQDEGEAVTYLGEAIRQLRADADAGRTDHPCGVRFAAEVVDVLAEAQRLLDA